jgi:hypothetical protein
MTEKPLDRLNYFNGQRLEASDLKTEQEYHIRVRRWLNKSLYSPGIARGLEVRAVKNEPAVMVSPGLALDAQGREIILWEEQKVKISSEARQRPGNTEAEVEGLYLTIRYSEEATAVEKDGCEVVGGTTRGDHPAWGGPTRVRARAIFEQRDFLPPESSGEVVLALVELKDNCNEVDHVDVGVRRYVGAASAAKVRQYALEGARDIDWKNPARIYFHIRGRQPQAVTLYLRGEILPTIYYTELGQHKHDLKIAFEDHRLPEHKHSVGGLSTTEGEGGHDHSMFGNMSDFEPPIFSSNRYDGFAFGYRPGNPIGNQQQQEIWNRHTETEFLTHLNLGLSFRGGEHPHHIAAGAMTGPHQENPLSHIPTASSKSDSVESGAIDPSPNYSARSGPPLKYIENLEIWFGRDDSDPVNKTEEIKGQLAARAPIDWANKELGNGLKDHVLVKRGQVLSGWTFCPASPFLKANTISNCGHQEKLTTLKIAQFRTVAGSFTTFTSNRSQ